MMEVLQEPFTIIFQNISYPYQTSFHSNGNTCENEGVASDNPWSLLLLALRRITSCLTYTI